MFSLTDREFLIFSTISAILCIALGLMAHFSAPQGLPYYMAAAMIVTGSGLLIFTLATWQRRDKLAVLRCLLAGTMALMLVGFLFGFDPTASLRPQGRFVAVGDSALARI